MRQLKLLVVVLVLSNVGLGVFSFYVLRTLDRNYTALIAGSVPLLNTLQTLTSQSVDAMRGTGSDLTSAAAGERDLAIERARVAIANDRRLRGVALKAAWLPNLQEARGKLATTGEAFTQASLEVLNLFAAANPAEAGRKRETILRPAFDRYLASATKAADLLEEESLRTSQAITSKTGNLSTVVLGIASWPLLLLVALLVLTAVFVLVLMVLFRGREMSDMP